MPLKIINIRLLYQNIRKIKISRNIIKNFVKNIITFLNDGILYFFQIKIYLCNFMEFYGHRHVLNRSAQKRIFSNKFAISLSLILSTSLLILSDVMCII